MAIRIKICGITCIEDALAAANCGANAIGLNFFGQSKRCVSVTTAEEIVRVLPPTVDPVALFVNETLPNAIDIVAHFQSIRTIQWHNDFLEPMSWPPYRFIPAFQVGDRESLAVMARFLDRCQELGQLPAAVLVDGHRAGGYGGTGQVVPWQLLADFHPGVPLILAGGLTPDNVAEAIRIVRPFAVDVASGVESRPGQKDPHKMRQFIDNVRQAV